MKIRMSLIGKRFRQHFLENLQNSLDFEAINSCLTETQHETNTVNRILAKGYKASKQSQQVQLQNYDCAIQIDQNLEMLEIYFQ